MSIQESVEVNSIRNVYFYLHIFGLTFYEFEVFSLENNNITHEKSMCISPSLIPLSRVSKEYD